MRYLPHTEEDIREMLEFVGAESVESLFQSIPGESRRDHELNLPGPLTEWELTERLEKLAEQGGGDWKVFLGAGSQSHYIPAIVPYLSSRQEFLTSYTPYQPELSQGTLQAIFEFQTLISRLVGLPITNASMYDGATAMSEAALMSQRITKRKNIVVSSLVHPHWREVLHTYLAPMEDVRITTLPANSEGRTDFSALREVEDPAVLLLQSPNFLGVLEDQERTAKEIHDLGGLFASGFSEAFAPGLMKSPGKCGADIVFGEGQSLGLSQGFGGPTLGLLSCKTELMRQIPGRLVGRTVDREGRRGFVLTLATREQHIRRSKAVSNICSNAGHCALIATIFIAALGGTGFRKLARVNYERSEYIKAGLRNLGFEPISAIPTFNEFTMKAPAGFAEKREKLKERKILLGIPLVDYYPDMKDFYLFGVSETKTKGDIDLVLDSLR